MKNIALIFAGGTGSRLSSASVPKQFLVLSGKPVIIHTLEYFQLSPLIDRICVVCLEEKIDYLKGLLSRYDISKADMVIPGGSTGQESIFLGLRKISAETHGDTDVVVLIHDGVRPLIDAQTVEACVSCAHANGSAITVSPAIETIMTTYENGNIDAVIDRKNARLVRAPQCFYLHEIYAAHLRARAEGYTEAIDSATLMRHYGHTLHTVTGPAENIKITTASDYFMARAIMDARENSQLAGL
ncbi:MAG: 2-C-methyl-D-erythritol 4-phosphate cytidylyltransferase [Clostridia bacterium]|nr:2-C-methyl-D-erythritol 4-phosphate cytidylyltransferase [Clostridia bacterium]